MSQSTQISAFNFENAAIRVITIDNEPWFIAKDLCEALNLSNSRMALLALDDDEKGVSSTYTLGGEQELSIVSESGMYTLILRCRDAVKKGSVPHRFRKWVTAEVLPQIRKTGKYSVQQQLVLPEPEPQKTYNTNTTAKEIHELVWLLFSHEQMRLLLGSMIKPLEAIGSRYSGAVYGNYTEYKRHYDSCMPILKRFVEQIKADNPKAWESLQHRLTAK